MEKFKIGSLVVDNDEMCPPRKVVMEFCEHYNKKVKGLLGTTDNVVIILTDYNKRLYKPYKITGREPVKEV